MDKRIAAILMVCIAVISVIATWRITLTFAPKAIDLRYGGQYYPSEWLLYGHPARARALAYNPEVLLMDEPFGSLDAQTRKIMQGELVRIWEETKKTVIFVTHSVIEATYLADKIIVMTARPRTVKGIIDVDLPRPRNYTGKEYLSIRREVLDLLEEEVTKSIGKQS